MFCLGNTDSVEAGIVFVYVCLIGEIARKSTKHLRCEIYSVYPRTLSSQHLYSGDPAYSFTRKLKLSWIIATTTPVIFGKLIPGL